MDYLPIKYSQQMKEYFKGKGAPEVFLRNGNKHMNELLESLRNEHGFESALIRSGAFFGRSNECKAVYIQKELSDEMREIVMKAIPEYRMCVDWEKNLSQYIHMRLILDEWDKYKLSYRISKEMQETLYNMNIPDITIADLMSIPAPVTYIECDGGFVCDKTYAGFFATVTNVDGIVRVDVMGINATGTRQHFTNIGYNVPLDDEDDISEELGASFGTDGNGKYYSVGCKFIRMFINLLMYIKAVNNDVEWSVRTKENYKPRKPQDKPQPKFREVEEFDVGYKFAQDIKAGKKRYKYIKAESKDGSEDSGALKEKRKYSPCYRSAHWHHFWTGSGDNKKLVVKMLPGTFVKGNTGKSVSKATIHRVR